MTIVNRYIEHPDVRNIQSIHKHINSIHKMFIDCGFIQSEDISQYDLDAVADFDYSVFLETSSFNTFYDVGRLVFDFPDFYDDDGCELKLKIGVVFSIIKNTGYSTPNLSDVSIRFHHRYFFTTQTNGESEPLSPFTILNAGYNIYYSNNDIAYRGAQYLNTSYNSIISYDKVSKTLYFNFCPYYRWGHNNGGSYSSLSLFMGTMARDKFDKFYNGEDCSFVFALPYNSVSSASTPSTFGISWYSLSSSGNITSDILNTPLTLTSSALNNGTAYYQNFYTQTKHSLYSSPSKNIVIAHKDFTGSHNIISELTYDGENVGKFICVDTLTYGRCYMNSDSSGTYRFLIRVSSNE